MKDEEEILRKREKKRSSVMLCNNVFVVLRQVVVMDKIALSLPVFLRGRKSHPQVLVVCSACR